MDKTPLIVGSAAGVAAEILPNGLRVVASPTAGQEGRLFPIRTRAATVGRDASRESPDYLVIQDGGVSRAHASVCRDGDRRVVADEGSTNGSFINGARVTRGKASVGDVVLWRRCPLATLSALPTRSVWCARTRAERSKTPWGFWGNHRRWPSCARG